MTVNPGQEIWLRWQDPDDAGNDHGLAIDDFSVVAHGVPGDNAPSVTGTTPANNAINVPVASTIAITFSESVTATASAFSVQCPLGAPQAFSQSASPASSFTLTPASPLPANTTCTVTVTGEPGDGYGPERSAGSDDGRLHVLLHDRVAGTAGRDERDHQ